MIQIKNKEDNEYMLVDAILIILSKDGLETISILQFELLKCGIMVQQPLLGETIKYLEGHKVIKYKKKFTINLNNDIKLSLIAKFKIFIVTLYLKCTRLHS